MLESKLQKKYDFFDYYSELIIPKENYEYSSENKNISENNDKIQPEYENNNLIIENSTFIIKAPDNKKILLILSIDKELPSKIEKNIYPIPLELPVLQAISFMHETHNESILILTGSENSIDKNEVFQIQLKQLMHEALYNLLKDIKNATKIIPIKDSFALVLHCSTEKYENGGLKLWKDFKEEIYNFNKVYNFTYNNQYNKVICLDNKEAPFILSIYNFDESYFNKKQNEILQPEFFVKIGEYLINTKEEDLESFLHFETFSNIILFWAKLKKENLGFLFGIFFINFKKKECFDYVEFKFDGKHKYFFKINKNLNEIYVFNLSEELLFIYSFKTEKESQKEELSTDNLFLSKIKFGGNIKGIDFTANNGMVVLTEQYNLVCYSRNDPLFKEYQKKYERGFSQNNSNIENTSEKEEKLKTYENKTDDLIPDIINQDNDFELKKYNSEKIINYEKRNENNVNIENKMINDFNRQNQKNKNEKNNINEDNKEKSSENEDSEIQLKMKEELEKRKELLNKQNELFDKLKVKIKEKNIIIKLANSFENKLSKFEEKLLSGISQLKLEEIFNRIQLNNSRKVYKFDNFDFILMKSKNFIYEIQSIIPDIKYNKIKIINFLKNEIKRKKLKKDKDKYNCNFDSIELINESLNLELKANPNQKKEIERILYNCSLIDMKINFFAKVNGIIDIYEKKLNLLLLKCKNDINQINEMYKYNKIKMSKNEEAELINVLIKPFIEYLDKEIKELKEKINTFIENEPGEYDNENIGKNQLINKYDNIEKSNLENQLCFNLQDILEKNKFYSLNENIIKNHYIDLENEFE